MEPQQYFTTHFRVDGPAPEPPRDWLWELLSEEGRQKLADTYRQFPHLRPQKKTPPALQTGGAQDPA